VRGNRGAVVALNVEAAAGPAIGAAVLTTGAGCPETNEPAALFLT